MKAATYSRYSSRAQREASIEDQARNCRRIAEREGFEVGEVYADAGISGSRCDRPAYQRMLADAKARRFDVLLVDDLADKTHRGLEGQARKQYWTGGRVYGYKLGSAWRRSRSSAGPVGASRGADHDALLRG